MIKYRRLTAEEFNLFEKDFIRFLAANSIQAADWQNLKSNSPEKVDELLDIFSDMVLEKVYNKAEYLLIVRPLEIHCFKMGEFSARLLGVKFKKPDLDLTKDDGLSGIFNSEESFLENNPELFSLEKKYDKSKADEVYFLLKQGAEVVEKKWFVFLMNLKVI